MELDRWGRRKMEEKGSDHHDQPSTKVPRLQLLDQQRPPASSFGLALFTPQQHPNDSNTGSKILSFSPLPDTTSTRSPPGIGGTGSFSLAQWQELELQALIYKYILAGIPVPMELVLPIRKTLLAGSGIPYYHHQFHPPMIQSGGYWGRCVIDPEPGRCRRTDGKKWRCSREVVPGHKYCERHVHRGRNRSRKHVEVPTPAAPAPAAGFKTNFITSPQLITVEDKEETSGNVSKNGYSFDFATKQLQHDDNKSNNRVLRRFFDDWPRSNANDNNSKTSPETSTTHLSMSICSNSSDFSLKLGINSENKPGINHKSLGDELQPTNNWSGWNNGEALMGGPLAEALRSSASTPSPTSVLHKVHGSMSETSSISI